MVLPSVKKTPIKLFFLTVLTGFLIALAINSYVSSYGRRFVLDDDFHSPFAAESAEIPVAIVLGASVYGDGSLSPALEERAKAALGLYQRGIVKKIIVSGDNRTVSYNEVIPIRLYLLENAVPAEDIFSDFAGFNTYDSMYRAGRIFGAKNVLVVTQGFHLPRAIYAARNLGLNAYGVPADAYRNDGARNGPEDDLGLDAKDKTKDGVKSDFRNDAKNYVREFFATVKTFLRVAIKAEPTYLGREIPIAGDGRESLK